MKLDKQVEKRLSNIVLEAYIEGLKDGRSGGGNRHIRIRDLRKGMPATYEVGELQKQASQELDNQRKGYRERLVKLILKIDRKVQSESGVNNFALYLIMLLEE